MNLLAKFKEVMKLNNVVLDALEDEEEEDEGDNSEALIQFQETFNNSNKVSVAVITKKLSTGIDLNRNVCAIHLVDIPYTPEVEEQFLGRSVRQGNDIKTVSVYRYNTNGTLDEVKREILKEKGNWQTDLLKSVGDNGANEIDNMTIDQEQVIAEAIARFGVNFTTDDLKVIIDEKKDKQAQIMEEERELRRSTLRAELDKVVKNKSYMDYGDSTQIKKSLYLNEHLKNESVNTYKLEKEDQILPTYKKVITNTEDATAVMINKAMKVPFENGKIDIKQLKEHLESVKTQFLEQGSLDYIPHRYGQAFKRLQADEIVLVNAGTMENKYTYYPENWETIKNPLTNAQKTQMVKHFNKQYKTGVEVVIKKAKELNDTNEALASTLETYMQVANEDDTELELYKGLLTGDSIIIQEDVRVNPDYEVVSKKETLQVCDFRIGSGWSDAYKRMFIVNYENEDYYCRYTTSIYDNTDTLKISEHTITDKKCKYIKKDNMFDTALKLATDKIKEKFFQPEDNKKDEELTYDSGSEVVTASEIQLKKTTNYENPRSNPTATVRGEYVAIVNGIIPFAFNKRAVLRDYINSYNKEVELDTIIIESIDNIETIVGFDEEGNKKVLFTYEYSGAKGSDYKAEIKAYLKQLQDVLDKAKVNGHS